MIEATKRIESSGRPRTDSIVTTAPILTAGMVERRASASRMPTGKAIPIATTVRISVTGSPPQDEVGTSSSPRPPPISQTISASAAVQSWSNRGVQLAGRTDQPSSARISRQTRAGRQRSSTG